MNKPRIYSSLTHSGRVWVLRWFDGSGRWFEFGSWESAMKGLEEWIKRKQLLQQ